MLPKPRAGMASGVGQMDLTKLAFRSQGRDNRRTDVHGTVAKGLLV